MKLKRILALALVAILIPLGSMADETRYYYDYNFPYGSFSLENFRNTLRGLYQLDVMPLKPTAKRVLDHMEYGSDAASQAEYGGTGVTITTDSSVEEEGSYCLKAVIDGTGDREFARTLSINLGSFTSIQTWERSSGTIDEIKFYVEDSSANQSYWDITTNASADTWQQDTLTLASPDGNNGSDADLTDIVEYGFQSLDASTTYYFDTVRAVAGMNVVVLGTNLGDYYKNVYLGEQPLEVDAQTSPTLVAPSANPRIDILTINSAGTLAWVEGTEDSSPAVPWEDLEEDQLPIALVYCKTTMTKVTDYEDKDIDTDQGYIYSDVRPFLSLGSSTPRKGADVASSSTITLGNDGNFFDITGTTNITSVTAKPAGTVVWLQFDGALTVTDGSNLRLNGDFGTASQSTLQLVSDGTNWYEVSRQPTAGDFLSLSDTPSSYSGQSLKGLRVNVGETAIEMFTRTWLGLSDTPSSFSGKGGYFPSVNTGENALEFVFGLTHVTVYTSGSGNFTVPSWCSRVYVTMVGGGGGGGSSYVGAGSGSGHSGGGGGGAHAIVMAPYTVTPSGTVAYVVGAGGTGGSTVNPPTDGAAGGYSRFGDLYVAGGGAGQKGGDNDTSDPVTAYPMTGVSASSDSITVKAGGYALVQAGGLGGAGASSAGGGTAGAGGGASALGNGAAGATTGSSRPSATLPGGGGGGGSTGASSDGQKGGNGGTGIVVLIY